MSLEGSRKFIVMWLGIISTLILAKYGPTWGGMFSSAAVIAAPALGAVLYYAINYFQKTTADVFVPDNWWAGKRILAGFLMTVITPMLGAATSDLKDAVTQTVALAADLIIPLGFMIFQGLSDKKLAAVPSLSAPKTPLKTTPYVDPLASAAGSVPINTKAIPVSLVKDRIAALIMVVSNKVGKWDYLMENLGDKINKQMKLMLDMNPGMQTIDAVKAVVEQYMNLKLTTQMCQDIQSVLGLPAVLHSYGDKLILQSFKDAETVGTLPQYISTIFQNFAIRYAQMNIVEEAILRVENDGLPIEQRQLALQEFGLPENVTKSAIFSGGMVMINWMGVWRVFNGYQLADVETNV